MSKEISDDCFIPFKESIADYPLPKRFTFPFYYEPHPLCRLAAKELQANIQAQKNWGYSFGNDPNKDTEAGKMFGILVVQNQQQELGYLVGFSGKIGDSNHHEGFVPPVFDVFKAGGFFNKGMAELDRMTREIEVLEKDTTFTSSQALLAKEQALAATELGTLKDQMKLAKAARKLRRQEVKQQTPELFDTLQETLAAESIASHNHLKKIRKYWADRMAVIQEQVLHYTAQITSLKEKRKKKSSLLQRELFEKYHFLNQYGEVKSLLDIFEHTTQKMPPAGAGECAAPKLLQYAFQHQLRPIAMAEFWWGASSLSTIRKHGHFYPTCRGKCEPILLHMLKGIEMEENPMLSNPAKGKVLDIIYEDDYLLAVNKPAEFLSVPGKNIQDSVWLRMKQKLPTATGPLVVHRLDMSTSGILLIAKSKEIHKQLQRQFIERTVKKRYVALLDGVVSTDEGLINLPLRVDLDNRPHQMVCYKHGKTARTKWKVVERTNQQTKIHFFPITGRTHQLRVHAAHPLGLNTAIVGDDLYGSRADRLYLHAEWIGFEHPVTTERMELLVDGF